MPQIVVPDPDALYLVDGIRTPLISVSDDNRYKRFKRQLRVCFYRRLRGSHAVIDLVLERGVSLPPPAAVLYRSRNGDFVDACSVVWP